MYGLKFILLLSVFMTAACHHKDDMESESNVDLQLAKGVLLTTRINSFDDLKAIVDIEYSKGIRNKVILRQTVGQEVVTSVLKSGISENDFIRAKKETIWDKMWVAIQSPYAVACRQELLKAYMLARRKYEVYGEGDVAFYDFAEQMVGNISNYDLSHTTAADLSEKGYLNTFNHFISQAFYTSIFSERMADFIADVHERNRLPELITGDFSDAQILDINEGAVDNYIDIINNEWGQEYGKMLKRKYGINTETYWTPQLMVAYLNDIQSYFSWAFGIAFQPFRTEDNVIRRYAFRINSIMDDPSIFLE